MKIIVGCGISTVSKVKTQSSDGPSYLSHALLLSCFHRHPSADRCADFAQISVHLIHLRLDFALHSPPIPVVRRLTVSTYDLFQQTKISIRHSRAVRSINDECTNASTAQIKSQDVCIICLQRMRVFVKDDLATDPPTSRRWSASLANRGYQPKRLMCGHVFHHGCLLGWVRRQPTCPTCRRDVQ